MASIIAGGIAGAGMLGGVAQGIIGSKAARDAASAQRTADEKAADLQTGAISTIGGTLQPYIDTGTAALGNLGAYTPQAQQMLMAQYGNASNLQPGSMTQAELEQTPGYQWNLSQGLKAVQNSAAARGLGFSDSAMKAAATYATGLADSTYKDQFNIKQQQFTDANTLLGSLGTITGQGYDQYLKTAALGDTAANQLGQYTTTLTGGAASDLVGAGQATAAAITGSAKQIGNAINSVTSAPANYFGLGGTVSGNSGDAGLAGPAISGVNSNPYVTATPSMTAAPNFFAGGFGGPGH